jgi:hypothetical protein
MRKQNGIDRPRSDRAKKISRARAMEAIVVIREYIDDIAHEVCVADEVSNAEARSLEEIAEDLETMARVKGWL